MLTRSLDDARTAARQLWETRWPARFAIPASTGRGRAGPGASGSGTPPPEDDPGAIIGQVREPVVRARLQRELTDLRDAGPRRPLHVVVFGTGSAGKTALINALLGRDVGETEAVMGTTRRGAPHTSTIEGTAGEGTLLLTDTPGISLAGAEGAWGESVARELALRADLILFVVDHDLLRSEHNALASLVRQGKRALVVLNKKDRFPEPDLQAILDRLRERLAGFVAPEDIVPAAAAPRPLPVRVRKPDGTEETVLEYEEPDLTCLGERLEAVIAREGDTLRAGNLLLRTYLLQKSAREELIRQRRAQAEAIIDRHQWMAATAAFAVPVPELDMMAAGAVEFRMVSEIAAVYGAGLSPEHVRMISLQMAQALVGRRIVETALTLVSGAFKATLIGYAAGGLVQAVTIAYLTRVTGRTFLDYFEHGQSWGEGGMPGALARQVAMSGRTEFLKGFIRQAFDQVLRRGPGAHPDDPGPGTGPDPPPRSAQSK